MTGRRPQLDPITSNLVVPGTITGSNVASPTTRLWDDARVSLTRATTGPNAPTFAAHRDTLNANSFSASTMNEMWGELQLSHGYYSGSDIKPHLHWSPGNSTNTGVVRWGLEYSWANIGAAFPASTTVYVEQAGPGVAYQQMLAAFATLTGTGKMDSSVLMFRVFRDAANGADTATFAAFALSFDVHFEIDGVGGPETPA